MDDAIIARLNHVTVAIPANTPATAASHVATLALLSRRAG
jgi:hypothetical protein